MGSGWLSITLSFAEAAVYNTITSETRENPGRADSYCSFAPDKLCMRAMHESTKREVLEIIFSAFATWSAPFELACEKGCAICCTQDVMMGKEEAVLLLDYAVGEHGPEWLARKLS